MTFSGLLTAVVTPFSDGSLDESTFRALIRRQIEGGVEGLVPVGTTGEAPTLPIDDHLKVVGWAIEEAGGVPVLAGIGSNSTATAIATGKAVQAAGVQGVLATAPYYNKPTQEGLYRHFAAIAGALDVEVCVYDVPGRTAVHILPETIERLAAIDNITCVKDATADMANATEIMRRCGDRIGILSGDDFTTVPLMAIGGAGTISVASNLVPARMRAMVDAVREGRLADAQAMNMQLFPLFRALFLESNPIPAKAAMAAMGLLREELRLPLCPMGEGARQTLMQVLRDQELI